MSKRWYVQIKIIFLQVKVHNINSKRAQNFNGENISGVNHESKMET